MKASDLKIGESYRHKDHPTYCWAKVVKVLKPKEGENPHKYIIVKCEYSQSKDDDFALIKYFKPANLVEGTKAEKAVPTCFDRAESGGRVFDNCKFINDCKNVRSICGNNPID